VVSSSAPSLFCLSAASLDRWPQSVLLFHLDPKHSKPFFFWLPAQDLFEPFSKVFLGLLEGNAMGRGLKALMTRKFYLFTTRGFQRRGRPRVTSSSAGTWRSHQIWGPKSRIPKLSFCLGISAETPLTFECQVQAVHLPTLKSCRPSAVKLIPASV